MAKPSQRRQTVPKSCTGHKKLRGLERTDRVLGISKSYIFSDSERNRVDYCNNILASSQS